MVTDHFRSKRITAAGLMTSPWPRAIKVRSCDGNRDCRCGPSERMVRPCKKLIEKGGIGGASY